MTIALRLVRHAAYSIIRCRVRIRARTALQLMKGRTTFTPFVFFGETVLFKIPQTAEAVSRLEEHWECEVWLVCAVMNGVALFGTPSGIQSGSVEEEVGQRAVVAG